MKKLYLKWTGAALSLSLSLLCSCGVPLPEPEELTDQSSTPSSTPLEVWVDEPGQPQETPADMGSYVTENTTLPVHFDVDNIRMETTEAAGVVADIYRAMNYYVSLDLDRRLAMAQSARVDMIISLHANSVAYSSTASSANGVEVYYYEGISKGLPIGYNKDKTNTSDNKRKIGFVIIVFSVLFHRKTDGF